MRGIGVSNHPVKLPSFSRKGNRLIFRCWILVGACSFLLGFVCGNTRELEAGRKRRRQRFLFCLKKWNGKEGQRVHASRRGRAPSIFSKRVANQNYSLTLSFLLKRTKPFFVPPALFIPHENSRESISFQSSRSINRSRCPRCIVSSFEQNVCKGSRQNGSVTSE